VLLLIFDVFRISNALSLFLSSDKSIVSDGPDEVERSNPSKLCSKISIILLAELFFVLLLIRFSFNNFSSDSVLVRKIILLLLLLILN
jgi:hypothetical protein